MHVLSVTGQKIACQHTAPFPDGCRQRHGDKAWWSGKRIGDRRAYIFFLITTAGRWSEWETLSSVAASFNASRERKSRLRQSQRETPTPELPPGPCCVCVRVYTRAHTYTNTNTRTRTHARTHTHTHTHLFQDEQLY
jgi:hypothetical protein